MTTLDVLLMLGTIHLHLTLFWTRILRIEERVTHVEELLRVKQ